MPDIFDIQQTCLPADIRALSINQVDNFALKFYKSAFYSKADNKFFFKKGVDEMVPNFGHVNWNAIVARQSGAAKSLFSEHHVNFSVSPEWRMVIGISGGGTSVYETGMTLHHVYGIPYIPSSSLKGIVRGWIIMELFGGNEDAAKKNRLFADLFGSDDKGYKKEQRGGIIFMDAYPSEAPTLKTDVMNPHYQHWYSEGNQPHDAGKPIPIMFLTVAHPSKFQIILGANNTIRYDEEFTSTGNFSMFLPEGSGLSKNSSLLDIATYWTQQALTQRGIGAKTAVGYGYMKAQKQKSPTNGGGTKPPDTPAKLTDGQEVEVTVDDIQANGLLIKATNPINKNHVLAIQEIPKTVQLKLGDIVVVRCKLNRNGNLDKFIFVRVK